MDIRTTYREIAAAIEATAPATFDELKALVDQQLKARPAPSAPMAPLRSQLSRRPDLEALAPGPKAFKAAKLKAPKAAAKPRAKRASSRNPRGPKAWSFRQRVDVNKRQRADHLARSFQLSNKLDSRRC